VRLLVVIFFCSVALAADLEERLRQADVRIARRFSTLALKADKLGQRASARRIFERALVLDPKNRIARGKLGYKKSGGEWVRPSGVAIEIDAWEDSDPDRAAKLRDERGKLEQMRAREVLKLTGKWGTPETARPALLALLDNLPRMEAVHVALGHEKIGAVYVRHELTDFMRAMPQRMDRWTACRKPGVAELTGESIDLPGITMPSAVARIGTREVVAASTPEQSKNFAAHSACPQKFVRLLLGDDASIWDPSPVYFLSAIQYRDFIHARHADEKTRKQRVKYAVYRGKDCVAVRMMTFELALDLYAHNVGFFTASRTASPKKADGKRDTNRYAWFREGLGLLLSLELLDSAECWFSSSTESAGKAKPTLPLPANRTRASCLAYLRGQLLDGVLPPLREIWGNSLNNLDRVRALQAWSFVRFLALYDPPAFKRLPPALQEQGSGAQVERTTKALEKAFGKPAAELERLWRIYLLELS
jgi:tetratricopeptide (TPR) repeat protein